MKLKNKTFFVTLILIFTLGAYPAYALCPVCAVAIGAGIGLSQYLGVDDIITGLWIGALIITMILWTIEWLNKKNIYFKGRAILLIFFYYLISIGPLYRGGIIGHPLNKLWGVDKLVLGITIGSVIFFLATLISPWLKKKNNNRVYFPFQKVIVPIIPILLLSIYFYWIT